jgi:hypothetical protein
MSSQFSASDPASKGIDGNTKEIKFHMFMTKRRNNPWWEVDL